MNNIVLDYIRKFYIRVQGEISATDLDVDTFFENWTINFHNNCISNYRLYDGTGIDEHVLLELVHEDAMKGFFVRKVTKNSVHYRMTELGKQYVLLKLEL